MSVFPHILIFIITFVLTLLAEKRLIPILRAKAAQPIYSEGPRWHMSKQGTPTMGGLGFLITTALSCTFVIIYLFLSGEAYFATSFILSASYAIFNALIGIIDDSAKIKRRENAGLTPIQKILMQTAVASVFLVLRNFFLGDGTTLHFTFGSFDLGVFYYPLCLVMLIATVNCANLTDGIDGLASGVSFAIFSVLGYLSLNANFEVSLLSSIIMGATLAFLVFNLHPAKIFMGDTGSLFLGSFAAAACISLGNPLIILLLGSVYILEGLSVIMQVTVFKLSGKRVFKMSPIHHHFEKCGWEENKIVIWAIIITFLLSVPAGYIFI